MYNPSNGFINAVMRWPVLGAAVAGITALNTDGVVAAASTFVAGGIAGAYGLNKFFKEDLCDCESEGYVKMGDPKIDWIIEYNSDSGSQRPWEVYSIFAGLEYTKQHYASYGSEESAKHKIEVLKGIADKVINKDK